MDEPTSALTAREIEDLFRIIRDLKSKGCGIVYISHRLEELQHIVDRVTIMRDGQYITSMNFKDATMDEIIANMVGREIKEKFPRVECEKGKLVLEVKNLNAGRLVRNVGFSLYEGEIVGFAGLMGAGRTETTRAIFGVDQKESGVIVLDGKEVSINKPEDAIKAGIVLAPEDRKKDRTPNLAPVSPIPLRDSTHAHMCPSPLSPLKGSFILRIPVPPIHIPAVPAATWTESEHRILAAAQQIWPQNTAAGV